MRSLFLLLLFGIFVVVIQGRPSQPEENSGNQEDYESDNGLPSEDTLEDSRFKDEDPTGQVEQSRRLLDLNRNTYLQKNIAEDGAARANLDVPDFKTARNRDVRNERSGGTLNTNDEYQFDAKRRQPNKYIENSDANDQFEAAQHFTGLDVNTYKSSRIHNTLISDNPVNKRTVDLKATPTEEGDILFENNREQLSKVEKTDYNNNEPFDVNQRTSYRKQYYNQIQADNRAMVDGNARNNEYLYINRDRRETKKRSEDDSEDNISNIENMLDPNSRNSEYLYINRGRREAKKNQADIDNISNVESSNEAADRSNSENEEMAIRRRIKKLSEEELEELFNSLSEEKRALLKKIIDDAEVAENTNSENVNKREITKKAGAVEDNNYNMEGSQSESSKVQGGVSSMDMSTEFPTSQNCDSPTTTKQTDNQDSTVITNSKSVQESISESNTESKVNNAEKRETVLNSFASITDSNKAQAEVSPNEQVTSKNENKREANIEDMSIIAFEDPNVAENDYIKQSSGKGDFSSQDEDMSQFSDDISGSYDGSKMFKRDVEKSQDLDSKLKSLAESFPNSDAYDDSEPYTGPLIRVKRKNSEQVMKKRSAAVLPDAKVGFFPYKAENEDEDADEGNEFDDDGFYDPTPNFVSGENKSPDSNSQQTGQEDANSILKTADHAKSAITDTDSGAMSLGSDTDNVLSGVEGADENLMFNSGIRNRRKTEDNVAENIDDSNLIQPGHDNTSNDEAKNNNEIGVPSFQENDAFGGLPHSYDGDLGRYKRIRRLKPSHSFEETSANT